MTLESLFAAPPYKRPTLPATDAQSAAFVPQTVVVPTAVPSSISPETINFFSAANQETSPLPDLALWINPFETPPGTINPFDPQSTITTSTAVLPDQPFLHPLPSLEDIASWNFPPINQSPRIYVPPDFLPKSLTLPGKPKISLLPPKTKARMMADPSFMQPYFPSV